jgi:hypothetical protein
LQMLTAVLGSTLFPRELDRPRASFTRLLLPCRTLCRRGGADAFYGLDIDLQTLSGSLATE